jgi:ketosteroid isomerase-like protein
MLMVVALAACKAAAPADNTVARQASADSAKAAIEASNAAFSTAMKAGDVNALMASYAPNATVMPPNMAPMSGSANIRTGFTGMLGMGKPTEFTITMDKIVVDGDMAVEHGHYVWASAGPNNTVMADTGKYLGHWHRMNGKWMMVDDIWNSNRPAMPAPPAPGRRS